MSLTILQVAYACAPVGPDATGGAEQILAALDRAAVRAGHRSLVVAPAGSRTAGTLVATPPVAARLDDAAVARARAATRAAVAAAIARHRPDLVHLHGIDFADVLPAPGPRVVVTLHLPLDRYPPTALRGDLTLVCVSDAQRATRPALGARVIDNGVALDGFVPRRRKRRFALQLARVCPEKGLHLAADACRAAGVPLVLGGQLFGYPAHVDYFRRELAPRLGGDGADRPPVRFVGPLGLARKRRLLAAARCLVVPSLCAETSSLVAMEALAAGTPVVAFGAGALPSIVEPGRTGFLVDPGDVAGLGRAIVAAADLDPDVCRAAAERRFSAEVMTARYLALYDRLAARRTTRAAAEAVS